MAWQTLADILRQDRQEEQDWLDETPVACPNDGFQLQTGPNGELHCPAGDWTRSAGTTNRFA